MDAGTLAPFGGRRGIHGVAAGSTGPGGRIIRALALVGTWIAVSDKADGGTYLDGNPA